VGHAYFYSAKRSEVVGKPDGVTGRRPQEGRFPYVKIPQTIPKPAQKAEFWVRVNKCWENCLLAIQTFKQLFPLHQPFPSLTPPKKIKQTSLGDHL
jgi:hypothetical protein